MTKWQGAGQPEAGQPGAGLSLRLWPPEGESRVLALLQALGVPPAPPGRLVLVEHAAFPEAAALRFQTALRAGGPRDSRDAFLDFASRDFAAFDRFAREEIVTGPERLIVPRASLEADPAGWLPGLLERLAPGAAGRAATLLPQARTWLQAHPAVPAQARSRHLDAEARQALERLVLTREVAEALYLELLGRRPEPGGALWLQQHASAEAGRAAIMASPEYRRRQAGEQPPPAADPRLRTEQPESFASLAEIFVRPEAQLRMLPPFGLEQDAALTALRAAGATVRRAQGDYQPFYGQEQAEVSPREAQLRSTVELLKNEFAPVRRKAQIRILDVGCNAGFVSLTLAETFPNTVGFDINPDNVALCRALKQHSGSPALFFQADLMRIAAQPDAGLEALDAVLFLNVVHQLIFAHGIPQVKAFLARVSRSVDLMVVELARQGDYAAHGKAHLLPADPVEILADCTGAKVTLIRQWPRPLYVVRRKALAVEGRDYPYERVDFSRHAEAQVSRKYYYGAETFTKEIRYSPRQSRQKFEAEAAGLATLAGLGVAPRLLARSCDDRVGRVVMERLQGQLLLQAMAMMLASERAHALREVVRIGATLAARGLIQNDFSAHNFIRLPDQTLRMIDFEQCGPEPLRDPFAALLWIACDLLVGVPKSYSLLQPADLNLPSEAARADGAAPPVRAPLTAYPLLDPQALREVFGPGLAAVLEAAGTTEQPWGQFIQDAWQQLRAA